MSNPRGLPRHCVDFTVAVVVEWFEVRDEPSLLPLASSATVPPIRRRKKMRKNLALGIFGLIVAFGLVLGAGANFRDYNADRSVHWDIVSDDNELIDLSPIQPYAYINDGGVLVVDISPNNPNYPGYGQGLSPNSEYNFDEVFEVSNDLWEENMSIVVRITNANTAIQFYGADYDIHDASTGATVYASDMAKNDVCFVVHNGDAVKVGMDFTVGNNAINTTESSTIHIQAWRLGTEPSDLAGKCGQPVSP